MALQFLYTAASSENTCPPKIVRTNPWEIPDPAVPPQEPGAPWALYERVAQFQAFLSERLCTVCPYGDRRGRPYMQMSSAVAP